MNGEGAPEAGTGGEDELIELEDAADDAVRKNSTIIIKEPFYRRSMDEWGDLNVEIIPPPLPPQKLPPGMAPKVFNPRKGDSI